LGTGVAFYQVFNFSEYHFQEDGLWANPTAKYPPENDGKEHYKHHKGEHAQHEYEEILGPENNPEQDEFAL
jgi:hypothetical protein